MENSQRHHQRTEMSNVPEKLWMSNFALKVSLPIFAPLYWYVFVIERENNLRSFSLLWPDQKILIGKTQLQLERFLVAVLIFLFMKFWTAFSVIISLFLTFCFFKFRFDWQGFSPFVFFAERIIRTVLVVCYLSLSIRYYYSFWDAPETTMFALVLRSAVFYMNLTTMVVLVLRAAEIYMSSLPPLHEQIKVKNDEIKQDSEKEIDFEDQIKGDSLKEIDSEDEIKQDSQKKVDSDDEIKEDSQKEEVESDSYVQINWNENGADYESY